MVETKMLDLYVPAYHMLHHAWTIRAFLYLVHQQPGLAILSTCAVALGFGLGSAVLSCGPCCGPMSVFPVEWHWRMGVVAWRIMTAPQ